MTSPSVNVLYIGPRPILDTIQHVNGGMENAATLLGTYSDRTDAVYHTLVAQHDPRVVDDLLATNDDAANALNPWLIDNAAADNGAASDVINASDGDDCVIGGDGNATITGGLGYRLFGDAALHASVAPRRRPRMAGQLRTRLTDGAPSKFFTSFAAKPVGYVPNADHTTGYECSKGSFK